MSTTIDQRIVEMQFDNKDFEKNVSQSMSTLEKLKQSLNLESASRGMEAIGGAVDTVRTKFSALQVMGVTAIANITNSAVNAGKRIVSALTVDPIKSGFSEYETQINSVQTILANTESKGKTLNDVNAALDELNAYADKTIYNFTEMTRNIGTFTAAGVDLDTSVAAIKGIANLAAVSGSTSQQASTAMYQLSQALSSGTVKLMDWNSVVNAGMGGQVFQDALKDTARVHGVAIDDMISKEGSFRETLQHGWLSAEILTETLSKFTGDLTEEQLKTMGYTDEQIKNIVKMGETANNAATKVKTFTQLFDTLKEAAQSGWTQSWELIVGDFEEAKAFLTEISDTIGGLIGESAEARNELLENWKVLGGRTDIIESIRNAFHGVMNIITPIKEAFREIFPPTTAEQLVAITGAVREFTEKFREAFKSGSKNADNLKRTFKGLFAVLDIVRMIFVAVVKAVFSLFDGVGTLGGGILDVTASFGDWLVKLRDFIAQGDVLDKVLQTVVTWIRTAIKYIRNFISALKEKILSPSWESFHKFLEVIHEKMSAVGNAVGDMGSNVSGAFMAMGAAVADCALVKVFMALWKAVKVIAKGIGNLFTALFEGLAGSLENLDLNSILELINNLLAGGVLIGIKQLIGDAGDIVEGFSDIVGGVGDCLEGFQTRLKADALLKIAGAIGILALALIILSSIDSDKMASALTAISTLFATLLGSMAIFTKITKSFDGALKAIGSMIAISVSVLILAAALRTIADLEFGQIVAGLYAIAGMMIILIAATKILGTGDNMQKGAMQIVIFAAAIKILSSVCIALSNLSITELMKGLYGVAVLLAEIALFVRMMPTADKLIWSSMAMVVMSAAVKILASACMDLAELKALKLIQGLYAIGIILGALTAFVKLAGNAGKLFGTSASLVVLSVAINLLANACLKFASISWGGLVRGLLAMAGSLAAIIVAMKFIPKGFAFEVLGLIVVASALSIVASALNKMGEMSWGAVARGLISLAGSLAILAIGLHAMNGTWGGSAALVIAVGALTLLAPVLSILGAMSWGSIAKGMVALAGAITIIGIAGYALTGAIPTILGLAGSFALVGLGMLLLGAGMVAFGAGLSAIAVGLTALVASISGSTVALIAAISAIMLGMVELVGDLIVGLCDVLIASAPAIAEAIIALIKMVCDVVIECLPMIWDTLVVLFIGILERLTEFLPKLITALVDLIIAVIGSLASNIPKIVQSLVDFLMVLFAGLIDALKSIDTTVLVNGLMSVGLIAALMLTLATMAALTPAAMVGALGMAAVVAELAGIIAAFGLIAQLPGLHWLIEEGGELLEVIGNAIGGFLGGIVGGIAEGITSALPQIGHDLAQFMINLAPFIDGATKLDPSVMEGVKSLAGVILALTAANILEGITAWITGGSSLTKFGEELAAFGPNIRAYADSVAGIDVAAVKASVEAAKALTDMASTVPNSGGVIGWFAGENSIAKFGTELVDLGKGLKGFSDAIVGISPEAIIAASEAAKVLADMTATIPNEGGVAAWFSGENSVSKFGRDVVKLGEGLKGFSDAIVGISPENIIAASKAAKELAVMTATIPNEGGVKAWFSGENSVAKFGRDVVKLGEGLKGFSDAIVGIVPENIIAASKAAKALAEMTATIPNEGGMKAWFTGEQSISSFANKLPKLGEGLKGFSDSIVGIVPENITAAANAAKALAEMTAIIPNVGGITAWFTGEQSIVGFAKKLPKLGEGLKGFSDSATGIVPENLTAAANAAKSLAEITAIIPNTGGITAWFTGDQNITQFAKRLPKLGEGLKGFSESVVGIVPENITAAAGAAKSLAEMTSIIPSQGGIQAWFTGEQSVSSFAKKLPKLGEGLKGFSDSVAGITPGNVTAAANAAKSLAEMTATVPKDSGKITSFGTNLKKFGDSLNGYFEKTSKISAESISTSTEAINSVKDMSTVNSGQIKNTAKAIDSLVKSIKGMAEIPNNATKNFEKAMKDLADTSVEALDDIEPDMKKAGKKALEAFVKGIKDNLKSAKSAGSDIAEKCAKAISDKSKAFKSAGGDLVDGFAKGISSNSYKAVAKAKAMAEAAVEAAREALKINSPSKVFRDVGYSVPEGMALGIDKLSGMVVDSTVSMGTSAISGVKDSISRIADAVNSDLDTQPTIRPVLDLSDVRSGAGLIGSMFGNGASVGVLANVGTINSMMNYRNQNGVNDDIISELGKLRRDIGKMNSTTNIINGVTYDDGSNINNAVETIVRAARVERRR